jgi:hypothetical protein
MTRSKFLNGFAAGVQAGYNHQIGAFMPGIEADLGYMRFNGSRVSPAEFDPEQWRAELTLAGPSVRVSNTG